MSVSTSSRLQAGFAGRQRGDGGAPTGDDQLSCKICLAPYSQRALPRSLDCQHTFCQTCLHELLNKSAAKKKQKDRRTAAVPCSVACPLCKCRTRLDAPAVDYLPVNTAAIQRSARSAARPSESIQWLPRTAVRNICSGKVKPNNQFLSCGTGGTRVHSQPFQSFHPPPRNAFQRNGVDSAEHDDAIWPAGSGPQARSQNGNRIRFASTDEHVEPGSWWDRANAEPEPQLVYRDDEPQLACQDDDVFEELPPVAEYVGHFGKRNDGLDHQPGSFRSPLSIACSSSPDGRVVVVDSGGSVQLFAANGDCLSSFRVEGATAACFMVESGRGEPLAVAGARGVSVCDQTGHVEKLLPVEGAVVAVAALRSCPGAGSDSGGGFVAAHATRLTVCDRYRPTAVLRTIGFVRPRGSAVIGDRGRPFSDITAVAAVSQQRRVYVLDAGAVLAVDVDSTTLLAVIASPGDRLVRRPTSVAIDPASQSLLVGDTAAHRVLQFQTGGGASDVRCLVMLAPDGVAAEWTCQSVAIGPRTADGRQLVYVVCCGRGVAEVRIYRF